MKTVMYMVKSGLFWLGTIHRPNFALADLLCMRGGDTRRWVWLVNKGKCVPVPKHSTFVTYVKPQCIIYLGTKWA